MEWAMGRTGAGALNLALPSSHMTNCSTPIFSAVKWVSTQPAPCYHHRALYVSAHSQFQKILQHPYEAVRRDYPHFMDEETGLEFLHSRLELLDSISQASFYPSKGLARRQAH